MKLEIGATYKVTIKDCCVNGEFVSRLTKAYELDDDCSEIPVSEEGYGVNVEFVNGVYLSMEGGVDLEKIDSINEGDIEQ